MSSLHLRPNTKSIWGNSKFKMAIIFFRVSMSSLGGVHLISGIIHFGHYTASTPQLNSEVYFLSIFSSISRCIFFNVSF